MWLEVDLPTFMDSMFIADGRGDRLRLGTPEAHVFLLSEGFMGVDLPDSLLTLGMPKIGIIQRGLFAGVYAYSGMDDFHRDRAFRWWVGPPPKVPLRLYGGLEMDDVAISYASEDREAYALPLAAELRRQGLSVYMVDVAEHPDDPIWRLRFRQGVYRSRHFVPIISEHYLAREGSLIEMFDMARLNVEHRRTEFFSPIIPWLTPRVRSCQALAERWRQRADPEFDKDGFSWLLKHLFAMPPEWDGSQVGVFLNSVCRSSRQLARDEAIDNTAMFSVLKPLVRACRLLRREGEPMTFATVALAHSWWGGRTHAFSVGTTWDPVTPDVDAARKAVRMRYMGIIGDDVDIVADYGPPEGYAEVLAMLGAE